MKQSESNLDHFFGLACPSIQYRVKSEIHKQSVDTIEMRKLQAEILLDPQVKKIFNSQMPDGWLGLRFHGYNSFESGIRVLVEKGVSTQHPIMVHAMNALERDSERIEHDLGSFGRYFDAHRMGGAHMIQAWLLALGGRINNQLVTEQVDIALEGMQTVLQKDIFLDNTEIYQNNLVFKPGIQWPGIYHLRLLASTLNWRTKTNLSMVSEAIKYLVQFSPIPYTRVRKGSQLIAPASFSMLDFHSDLSKLDDVGWMMWFHRTELLAKMGIIKNIKAVNQQVKNLNQILDQNLGWFTIPCKHTYFRQWGAYTGLMLEQDWKTEIHRINDLTFRSYLILQNDQFQQELLS